MIKPDKNVPRIGSRYPTGKNRRKNFWQYGTV